MLTLNVALAKGYSDESSGRCENSVVAGKRHCPLSYQTSTLLLSPAKASHHIPQPSWEVKIYKLESEARKLKLALEAIETELATARCAQGRIHNASTASCRIPESLLSEMFQLAVTTSGTATDEWEVIRAISSVSHHWRVVAQNTPRLWCRIECHLDHFDAKLRHFLERSRAAPLDITLTIESDEPAVVAPRMKIWVQAMASPLERCETLQIRSKDHTVSRVIFPIRVRMPLLRSFTWIIKDRAIEPVPEDWEPLMILDSALCAPTRVKVVRKNLGTSLPLLWDDKVLAGVKQLALEGWDGFPDHQVVNLISRCSSLRGLLWIRSVDSEDASHSTEIPILRSPTVEQLRLDLTIHDQAGSNVLRYMQFPCLKHVTIYSGDAASIPLADVGLGNRTRFPMLKTAWLSLFTFSPLQVATFINAHPSLETFGCALRASFIDFVRLLSEPGSIVPWSMKAPNLRTIYVICASYAWDGDRQSQECIDGLCDVLRALFVTRGAAANVNGQSFRVHLNDRSWSNLSKINPEYNRLRQEFPENLVLSGEEDDPPAVFHHIL